MKIFPWLQPFWLKDECWVRPSQAVPTAIPLHAETLCLDMLLATMWVATDPVASVNVGHRLPVPQRMRLRQL